jgi:hypothetical protein
MNRFALSHKQKPGLASQRRQRAPREKSGKEKFFSENPA